MTRRRRFDVDALLEVPDDFLDIPEGFLGLTDRSHQTAEVVPIRRAEPTEDSE